MKKFKSLKRIVLNALANALLTLLVLLGSGVVDVSAQIDYVPLSNWQHGNVNGSQHYVYRPAGMQAGQKYPVVLVLHGCCGENNNATPRNLVDPIVRVWHGFGKNQQIEPTYIVVGATQAGWSQHEANLKAVINNLVNNEQADPQRIYIMGFSMGADGTWSYINNDPNYFAAAMPMAYNASGNQNVHKNIPIWTGNGSTDTFANTLAQHVSAIRSLNGDPRGALSWETGVNPRYTLWEGKGHIIMWDQVTQPGFVEWALSKVKNGNVYPNIRFNGETNYYKDFPAGTSSASFTAVASDADGTIAKVEFYVNKTLQATVTASPYTASVPLSPGDNLVEAVAFDNGGKKSTTAIVAQVDATPALAITTLPAAKAAEYYEYQLQPTQGNAPLTFTAPGGLPSGFSIDQKTGLISGYTSQTGSFTVNVAIADKQNNILNKSLSLTVGAKAANAVQVSNVTVPTSNTPMIKVVRLGEDIGVNGTTTEISFSQNNSLMGATMIKLNNNDKDNSSANYLTFSVDRPTAVYVGYEDFNNLPSSIPSWLNSFTATGETVVAEYKYFKLYKKVFPTGQVVLGGANATANQVGTVYFVAVVPDAPNNPPVITSINTNVTSGNAPLSVNFSATVSDPDGDAITGYAWTFGPAGATSTQAAPTYIYQSATGSPFTATLVVTDSRGAQSTVASKQITVSEPPSSVLDVAAATTITVDGNLNESDWTNTTATTITKVIPGNPGTPNNTASFKARWSSTHLYIAVSVSDAALWNDGSATEPWHNDAVEIYIDGNNNKSTTYGSDDRQIIRVHTGSAIWTSSTISNLLHGVASVSGGYTVEVGIPWSSLGVTASANKHVGLDVGINDDDNGGTRESQLVWNGNGNNWSNTSAFGTIRLTGGGDTQAPSVPAGLSASNVTQTSFTLSWSPSTDNSGAVTGYEVFRDGTSLGTTPNTSMPVSGLSAGMTYAMTVRARDAVPNWSNASTPLNVTTTGTTPATVITFTGLTGSGYPGTSIAAANVWTASISGYIFRTNSAQGLTITTWGSSPANNGLYKQDWNSNIIDMEAANGSLFTISSLKTRLGWGSAHNLTITGYNAANAVVLTQSWTNQPAATTTLTVTSSSTQVKRLVFSFPGSPAGPAVLDDITVSAVSGGGGGSSFSRLSEEESVNDQTVSVYPNPVNKNVMTVNIHSDRKTEAKISMLSSTSQPLMDLHKTLAEGDNTFQISIEDIGNGLHLLIINKGYERIVKKVVIKK